MNTTILIYSCMIPVLHFVLYHNNNHNNIVVVVGQVLDQPFMKSYTNIHHAPCVTLYTRNIRMGCSTEDSTQTQVGIMMYYNSQTQSSWLSNIQNNDNDSDTTTPAFVAVIEDYDMTSTTMMALTENTNGRVQGIIILNSTSSTSSNNKNNNNENTIVSPDTTYPQGYGTPSESLHYGNVQYTWNSHGQNLLYNRY